MVLIAKRWRECQPIAEVDIVDDEDRLAIVGAAWGSAGFKPVIFDKFDYLLIFHLIFGIRFLDISATQTI